ARQERLTRHVNVLRRLLALLFDPDRTLPIIPIRLGIFTRVYRALWDSGSQGDFVHPRVVEETRLATSGSRSPISVTLGDNKTQRFFDHEVPDLHFSLTLQPSDSTQTPRRYHSSAYFDVLETGYDFVLGTPWSRQFRSTEAEWATETLVLKTKCGQTLRVPFIGTTGDTPPDLPPQDPRPSGSHPDIAFTSPRQFAHFIREEDVTFYSVNVMDLLRYDPLCPEVELISLEPDPPDPSSIFAAPISTSTRQPADTPSTSQAPALPTVESTYMSHDDADAEELTRFATDLEPAVRDLIREYRDVFPPYFSYSGIPPMRGVEHFIQLVPDYRVHHQAPYQLSIPEATKLKCQLEELLRLGFIKPSSFLWGAPVLFARKADGTLRLYIDYCGLNCYMVKNSYPMPCVDELFDRLAGNRFFTKIDLRSGYHQIHVATEDQPKTIFRSRFGHYEFTVMPFGLTNAMNDIFRDILEEYVLVYLDDILVYSRTLEDHLRHLRDVLQRLRKHDFYAKLSKCRFAQRKVNFLGQNVSDHGLHMDDAKITAIAEISEYLGKWKLHGYRSRWTKEDLIDNFAFNFDSNLVSEVKSEKPGDRRWKTYRENLYQRFKDEEIRYSINDLKSLTQGEDESVCTFGRRFEKMSKALMANGKLSEVQRCTIFICRLPKGKQKGILRDLSRDELEFSEVLKLAIKAANDDYKDLVWSELKHLEATPRDLVLEKYPDIDDRPWAPRQYTFDEPKTRPETKVDPIEKLTQVVQGLAKEVSEMTTKTEVVGYREKETLSPYSLRWDRRDTGPWRDIEKRNPRTLADYRTREQLDPPRRERQYGDRRESFSRPRDDDFGGRDDDRRRNDQSEIYPDRRDDAYHSPRYPQRREEYPRSPGYDKEAKSYDERDHRDDSRGRDRREDSRGRDRRDEA
ncbi:hypothetical protein CBR_g49382, partial [Chara braunii]